MSTDNPTPKPTIEERLQAVVETLELVAAMQRDHEKRMAEYDERWKQSAAQWDARAAQWDARAAQWDARFDKLLTIVESHERRLDNLESRQH